MQPLSVLAAGMVTGVGLDAPSTCAAIRAGLAAFADTPFVLDGEPVLGCAVPLERFSPSPSVAPLAEGIARLVQLVAPAIRDCLEYAEANGAPMDAAEIPLLLGVAELGHPGRPEGLEEHLLGDLATALGVRFHPTSRLLPHGRVAGARGMALAAELIHRERRPLCLVAGVESLFTMEALAAFHAEGRILAHGHPDGFVPAEAGAAVLLGAAGRGPEAGHRFRPQTHGPRSGDDLVCLGAGFGKTSPTDLPLRAEGLTTAIRAALRDAGRTAADLDYRIADLNGEQRAFKEAGLAAQRLRASKGRFDLWHPAESTGEIGAAAGPLAVGVALVAAKKGYAPGPLALLHFASDGGERAALVVHAPQEPPR